MIKRNRALVLCILFMAGLLYFACVDTLEISPPHQSLKLAVDGRITTGDQGNVVRLTYSASANSRVYNPVASAEVTISDDQGNSERLSFDGTQYVLAGDQVKGRVGSAYTLHIRMPDGKVYQSQPEVIPPAPQLDSLSYTVAFKQIPVANSTTLLEKAFFLLNLHLTMPAASGTKPYYRIDQENVFTLTELPVVGTPKTPATCYSYGDEHIQKILLLDGSNYQPGAAVELEVLEKRISEYFNQPFIFDVRVRSMSQASFDYWNAADQVANPPGSLFDTPPASVPGNLFNVEDREEEVLGFFEAVATDSIRIITTRADIAPLASLPSPPCDLGSFFAKDYCYFCLSLPNATMLRPHYWK